MSAIALAEFDSNKDELRCKGDWDIKQVPVLQHHFPTFNRQKTKAITINGQAVTKMDSAGALLLLQWQSLIEKQGINVCFKHFSNEQQQLIHIIKKNLAKVSSPHPPTKQNFLAAAGQYTIQSMGEMRDYLAFVGMLSWELLRIVSQPVRFRWQALANIIYRSGFLALPIIALLSFMIGVVITYQMGLQLKNYGANLYIVDLLGISILREFGPLLTAIMVAGRTGSSYTAQLGMMNINQEVDALNTMGVTPAELLLLPRIIGLVIALPLLTMWSDIFGVVGGMVMSNNMLDITWYDFLHRFPHAVKLKNLLIGLGKAPVFALIIASIGCFEGMQVKNTADSVGQNTTRSVVLAIFFIIVADAAFSVIFSKLKL